MLRFARCVVEQQAARQLVVIYQWIADEEQREAGRQASGARVARAADWLIQYGLNRAGRGARG
ncbi:hypothetical protein [Streptomyces sp. NPDC007856]|uniref:hypothetical protein n=1 Tax=Streptomyces sp. NPDC007856 TaxID=3364781 RepID=UPI003681DFA2